MSTLDVLTQVASLLSEIPQAIDSQIDLTLEETQAVHSSCGSNATQLKAFELNDKCL